MDPKNVTIVMQHSDWRSHRRQQSQTVALSQGEIDVVQNRMTIPGLGTTGGNDSVIWHWCRIGGRYADNPYVARLLGVWSDFVEGRSDAALIVVATPYEQDPALSIGQYLRDAAADQDHSVECLLMTR